MNTTNVFVELLVIGLGPVTALLLIALVVLGPATLELAQVLDATASLALVVPFLAVTYLLGIVTDRVADRLFAPTSGRLRRSFFVDNDEYHAARRTIIVYAPAIYRIRQYGRSRMRICRGWTVNLLILWIPANLYLAQVLPGGGLLWWVNALLVLILAGTVASWRWIARSEYEKIREGAAFVRREQAAGRLPVVTDEIHRD